MTTLSSATAAREERSLGPFDLFGHATRVVVDDALVARTLDAELSLYPASSQPVHRTVRVTHAAPEDGESADPPPHPRPDDGFIARYPNGTVRFRFADRRLREAELSIPRPAGGLHGWRSRWRSIQYANADEMAGQTLHELVLVPSLYFDEDRLPIHASAVELPDAGMTLIGGTGGVGKTSLELALCRHHGGRFAADDIAVVDRRGAVHPNLAYPKIYAYNLRDDLDLRNRVLGGAPLADRLQWRWRLARVGPAGVRRRVSPQALYGSVATAPAPLRRYLILVREHRPAVAVEQVATADAAATSVEILQGEYAAWHRQLTDDEREADAGGRPPSLRLAVRLEAFRALAEEVLGGVDCQRVRVPIGLGPAALRKAVVPILLAG